MPRLPPKLKPGSSDYFRHRAGLAWVRGDEAAAIRLEHQALLRDKNTHRNIRVQARRITKLMTHRPVA